jgi:putative nucleotidyltransferase with HDIG domain
MDLVLAEGFKSWPGFKIEVFAPGREPRLSKDPLLLALAGPGPGPSQGLRFFERDDPEAVAGLVTACFLPPGRQGAVPDREACYGLWARYAMLPNIILHSLMVAQVAARVAAALVRAGHDLDLPLIEAGALLHDIAKTECLASRCNHAERGQEILLGLGLPGVAEVVADHIDPVKTVDKAGLVSPSTVVNYADKRVLHDRVTSIPDRIEDLVVRYTTAPEHEDRIRTMGRAAQEVEARLFQGLDLAPEDLLTLNDAYYEGG